ncbi:uncharacterized protein LOC115089116 isoform X2 [Rhinatrema bivittatum]|uniref:uncharacterized protein LOC115089116 isoform X2 n=1 Tax=Rhinatrema bivittatum TaxID=194408 RepID=UPI00112C1809|nr:uncharacterized protein LOC115089116 isoform X2 [Rhinatrema bivittatum]
MSYKTRIHGFTAWINVRLYPFDCQINDVLTELFLGANLKLLLESLTGRNQTKMKILEGLSGTQILNRVEWFVEEIKKHDVIRENTYIDFHSIAQEKPQHVLGLLWKLITHDIWFTWERHSQLQHSDDKIVCSIPFKWTPKIPPAEKKEPEPESTLSLIATLEELSSKPHSSIGQILSPPTDKMDFQPFPGREQAKKYNKRIPKAGSSFYPSPMKCTLDQVNGLLKMTSLGRKKKVKCLEELQNSHILCSLVNAFLPGSFTTEVILKDRWATNLALKTLEALLFISTSFTTDDLQEEKLTLQIYIVESQLEALPTSHLGLDQAIERSDLRQKEEELKKELLWLKNNYDVEFCKAWVKHAQKVQENVKNTVLEKVKTRFETVMVLRNATISDFCFSFGINLLLTRGFGFYQVDATESIMFNRRVIVRKKDSGEFIEGFSGSQANVNIRQVLNLPHKKKADVNLKNSMDVQLFLESKSKYKILKTNSLFLYQVFPGSTYPWHQQLLRAIKACDYTTVKNLILFFKSAFPDDINLGEPSTGNSALHVACQFGCFEIALLLLEHGASMDLRNAHGRTPFYFAALGMHRKVCQLLIEWGCDLHVKDVRNQTALDVIRHEDLKSCVMDHKACLSNIITSVLQNNIEVVENIVKKHSAGDEVMASLRSRCIDGSTFLHTAAYYGKRDIIETLLALKIDVNLLDYVAATPLQRIRDMKTMQLLLSHGADINWTDANGNSALHMVSYGEPGKKDLLDCLQFLLTCKISRRKWNNKGLLPIHCAAIQGRTAIIRLLLEDDEEARATVEESFLKTKAPSPLSMAVANSHLECAKWLTSNEFTFYPDEAEGLMFCILLNEIKVKNSFQALGFLIKNGVKVNSLNTIGTSALHVAALRNDLYDILALLLNSGAEVDINDNEHCSPLFYAASASNFHGASLLIERGANVYHHNYKGLTAFDYISNFDEWLESGLFSDNIMELLEAYNMEQSYSLLIDMTEKLKKPEKHHWLSSIRESHPDWSVFRSKFDPYN